MGSSHFTPALPFWPPGQKHRFPKWPCSIIARSITATSGIDVAELDRGVRAEAAVVPVFGFELSGAPGCRELNSKSDGGTKSCCGLTRIS